jgi:hypothetical protein
LEELKLILLAMSKLLRTKNVIFQIAKKIRNGRLVFSELENKFVEVAFIYTLRSWEDWEVRDGYLTIFYTEKTFLP